MQQLIAEMNTKTVEIQIHGSFLGRFLGGCGDILGPGGRGTMWARGQGWGGCVGTYWGQY